MDIITNTYDNMTLNQLYSQLSIKLAEQNSVEDKDKVINESNKVEKSDYYDTSVSQYDENDFQRVLTKFKNKDSKIRSHEQIHASIGHTTTPISYNYQEGPDGKMYVIGGSVQLDTSIPTDTKAASFKLDMLRKASLAPTGASGADSGIATQANLNKMLLDTKGDTNEN